MADKHIALCLVDADNDFQQLLRADAEAAARRAGIALDVRFSGHDLPAQLSTLRSCIDAAEKPGAIVVLATRDRGLNRVVRDAARAGISFLYLNRTEDEVDLLRRDHPSVAIGVVCADEIETGRIQGRVFRTLLPHGRTVLYVQGSKRSLAARDRTAGMEEAVAGGSLEVALLEAGWSAGESREAVRNWLAIVARSNKRIDLVGCQNDQIAIGALEALESVAGEVGRPELAKTPVVGCDGTPEVGQRMVREGRLAATVVLARSAGPAVERAARFLLAGEMPPPVVMLKSTPYPDEATLRARVRS